MSKDNDKPFWWSLVEAAGFNPNLWEPVRVGDITKSKEWSLLSEGWVTTDTDPSTIRREYSKYDPPRIRPKKRRMITWRLCAFLEPWHVSSEGISKPVGNQTVDTFSRARLQWIQSDKIEAPWCAVEAQTLPVETVKTLPEGEEPRTQDTTWELLLIKDGVSWCRVKAVKPGECFVVAENGELIPIEREE